jgi:para-nitrobenzyl esterase
MTTSIGFNYAKAFRLLCLSSLIMAGCFAFGQSVPTDDGLLQGTVEDGLRVYRGIPDAAPPVGDLRWKAPQPAAKWKGTLKTNAFGRACMQTNAALTNLPPPSEDCLYLNVWTPAKSSNERLPVIVWIHGGGFVAGTPAEKLYHAEWLARKGVVVVTVSYRLGVFGFFAHPELTTESGTHSSGNYGLLDMIAGLKWVHRNIAAFGGDPEKVTIQGESAGAGAVSMLCASPLAKGLFRAAIAESGGSFGPVLANATFGEMLPLESAEASGESLLSTFGVKTIAEARNIPADQLMKKIPRPMGHFRPNMDSYVIVGDQYKLYQAGKYSDVPVLIGYNSDEGAAFGSPKSQQDYVQSVRERYQQFADKVLAAYPGGETPDGKRTARNLMRDSSFGWNTMVWARLQTKTGLSKVFVYYFDEKVEPPKGVDPASYGAPHGSELPYVFRQLTEHGRPAPTANDEALSEMMRTYWANFAKTDDPNGHGLPKWPSYNNANPQVLRIEAGTAKAGPMVNQAGLQTLDEYFASRRAAEDAPSSN